MQPIFMIESAIKTSEVNLDIYLGRGGADSSSATFQCNWEHPSALTVHISEYLIWSVKDTAHK